MAKSSKIAAAVGAAAQTSNHSGAGLGKAMEQAMADAITKAYADGISDPVKHRELMLEAGKKARVDYLAAQEAAAASAQETKH